MTITVRLEEMDKIVKSTEIKTTNIRIPHDVWLAAKLEGLETGESVNAMIIRLLQEYQKKQNKLKKTSENKSK